GAVRRRLARRERRQPHHLLTQWSQRPLLRRLDHRRRLILVCPRERGHGAGLTSALPTEAASGRARGRWRIRVLIVTASDDGRSGARAKYVRTRRVVRALAWRRAGSVVVEPPPPLSCVWHRAR